MPVPLLDLKRQYQNMKLKSEIDRAVFGVLEHTEFIMGPEARAFEEKLAAFCGTKYAVGVSSGTDALLIALRACGIKEGDEVITSTFSFFASAGVISRLGAKPVFVDIQPPTYNIDSSLIEQAITEKTKAIMPVHLYGQCADMDQILSIARKHGLSVVEDAAQAIGAKYKGRMAGTMGDFGCFSFYPTKNLGCAGDGGMIVSNFQDKEQFIRSLREHGANPKYYHAYIGYNSRLDTIQAAILSVKLNYLAEWTEARRKNAAYYSEAFKTLPVSIPKELPGNYHIYNQYTISTPRRKELLERLKARQISFAIYYPRPLHAQECYRYLGHKSTDFPIATQLSQEVVSLPVFPELKSEEREYVVDTISGFFK